MNEPTGSAIAMALGKTIGEVIDELRAENDKLREQRDRLAKSLSDAAHWHGDDRFDAILAEIEGEKK